MYTLPIDQILQRVGIQSRHVRTLQRLAPVMRPLAYEMALAFYDYLGRDPRAATGLWDDPQRVERLYAAFEDWYREIFAADYDEAYAEKRWRIGLMHARLGVHTSTLIPAVGHVHTLASEHILSALRPSEAADSLESFTKALALDTALLAESYEVAMVKGIDAGADWRAAARRGAEIILAESTARLAFIRGR